MEFAGIVIGAIAALLVLFIVLIACGAFQPRGKREKQILIYIESMLDETITSVNLNAHDGLTLSVTVFEVEQPKGIVQVVHGAHEHKERYYPFLRYLQAQGYLGIVSDVRGHGASVNAAFPRGHMSGLYQLMEDQFRLTQYAKAKYPDVPLTLLGHGFGADFARDYLKRYEEYFSKVILSATPCYQKGAAWKLVLARFNTLFMGYKGKNGAASRHGTDLSWLSYDEENKKEVAADKLWQSSYTNAAAFTMLQANRRLKRHFRTKYPAIKFLSVSGRDDLTTGGAAGLAQSKALLEEKGYSDIRIREYPDMKQDILHETAKETVWSDLVSFLAE